MQTLKSKWTVPGLLLAAGLAWPVGTWAQNAVHPPQPAHSALPPGAIHHGEKTAKPAHAEAEEEHGPAPINFNDFTNSEQPPLLAAIVNFGILAAAYYYFGKKPLAAALKERKAEITKEIEEAQRIKVAAETRAKVYEEKLASLESELKATRAALVEAGMGERAQLIHEAEAKAERLARDTQLLISQEMKQQAQVIWREAVETAVVAAEELLRVRVTPADQERLADEFLRELAQRPTPSSTAKGGVGA